MGRHVGAEAAEKLKLYGEYKIARELESYVNHLHDVISTSENKTLAYEMRSERKRLRSLEYENSWLRTALNTIAKSDASANELTRKARMALKAIKDD